MKPLPIKKREIIGGRIRRVCHVNLPKDPEEDFQERLIVVEMESGLKFTLQQESKITDPQTGKGLVFPDSGQLKLETVIDSSEKGDLNSPVASLVFPYGWTNSLGVLLENSFAMYDGFSDWDNGVLFHRVGDETRSNLVPFDLPD
jgi:hypothetical protein